MPDTTDVIIKSILETAERDGWTPLERMQALALLASDRPASKPAWKSASFWLLGLTAAAGITVAVTGGMAGNKTAAAAGAAAATVLVATQAVVNSRDKSTAATNAARKLDAAAGFTPPPGAAPRVPFSQTCNTCHGTRLVYTPDEHGKVEGTRPCPDCAA